MSWREQWETPQKRQEAQDRAALRTLGLNTSAYASLEQIKEKYRDLAQRWHPDRHSGSVQKAAAEAEFKKISQAFANLQRTTISSSHEFAVIDPFSGVPQYHYTRFPPWSFARGPPYAPSGFFFWIGFCGVAALYGALLYDAANPAFGNRRVERLQKADAEANERRLAAQAAEMAAANETSRAARDHLLSSHRASLEALRSAQLRDGRAGAPPSNPEAERKKCDT